MPPARSSEPDAMSTTQRSHSASTPSRDIVTPVPQCIATRPARARTSATSCSSSATSTSATARGALDREAARARRAAPRPRSASQCSRSSRSSAPSFEQRVGQRAEHGDVGAGPHGHVHVGDAPRSRCGGDRAPTPARRRAVLAQMADRIRERGAVAVRHDRVRADEDREARRPSGPTPGSASARRSRARPRRAPARCRR